MLRKILSRWWDPLQDHLRALPLYVPIFFLLGVNIFALGVLLYIFLPIPMTLPPFLLPSSIALGYAIWRLTRKRRD
ncbi:MAG: hypothetical protein NZM04_06445 [Methylacidiphilales bacterium]|nr:hypothetical protein [Candidatus Methylacidiphilales bacterium]MDW8349414.1 hypothetical protein [Verrucomicrobiae bacterium]